MASLKICRYFGKVDALSTFPGQSWTEYTFSIRKVDRGHDIKPIRLSFRPSVSQSVSQSATIKKKLFKFFLFRFLLSLRCLEFGTTTSLVLRRMDFFHMTR